MANLASTRRKLIAAIVVFLVVDAVCLGILLSPLSDKTGARDQEFRDLRAQVQQKAKLVIPPDQVDKRVQDARRQIAQFYKDRLPVESSRITDELGKLAARDNVFLSAAHYDTADTNVPDLMQVKIGANLTGSYEDVIRFINDLERDPSLFIVNSVNLVEQSGGRVRLAVEAETYQRRQSG